MERKTYEKPSIETIDVQWNECIAATSANSLVNVIQIQGGEKVDNYKWFGESNNAGTGSWANNSF